MRNGSKEKEKEDLEQENRRARVLALYSKNFNQEEIANELKIDQSTVSRDLRFIKEQAKKTIVDVYENISFEYLKHRAMINEIERELWSIAHNNTSQDNDTDKNRIQALSLLLEASRQNMEITAGETKSTRNQVGMTIMNHGRHLKQEMKTPEERRQDELELLTGMR